MAYLKEIMKLMDEYLYVEYLTMYMSQVVHIFLYFRIFVLWHISLRASFNSKEILVQLQKWFHLTHHCIDKDVYTFVKSISLKMNIIAQLWFGLV